MKLFRQIALSALITTGLFSAVTYTACKKSGCTTDCRNGGTCYNGSCSCPTGYEGTNCQTASRDKFIGVYTGADSCSDSTFRQYQITFSAGSDSLRFNMSGIYGNPDYTGVATITGSNTFSFIGSRFAASYSGSGKLSNDSLILSYHIQIDTTAYSCQFTGKHNG